MNESVTRDKVPNIDSKVPILLSQTVPVMSAPIKGDWLFGNSFPTTILNFDTPEEIHIYPSLEKNEILHLSCKFLTKHDILGSVLQADASLARILQESC